MQDIVRHRVHPANQASSRPVGLRSLRLLHWDSWSFMAGNRNCVLERENRRELLYRELVVGAPIIR